MPIFRSFTTKLKTSLSTSSSPDSTPMQSPVSPQVSSPLSFERLGGRKQDMTTTTSGRDVTSPNRPQVQDRSDSFMTQASHGSNESVVEKKQPKRLSRFREELDLEPEE
ncbi:uncharacterized protein yc1106_00418 [Curvularia clavata]|uniref:Uncharacterized protein n=1 Tax=Curvularia clavata TaxID=95742 RepID=A0A9Q8Z1K7_CURCL|nr:uncharacterized protein yc1106_00418 [Curvularia clavata]